MKKDSECGVNINIFVGESRHPIRGPVPALGVDIDESTIQCNPPDLQVSGTATDANTVHGFIANKNDSTDGCPGAVNFSKPQGTWHCQFNCVATGETYIIFIIACNAAGCEVDSEEHTCP